ncbi:MAG: class I SAM-dependent methyltransferase [Actinomycetota bacterium]|nr:class I SAM-dependent methyltransferase [Actinomycetota bacterium]
MSSRTDGADLDAVHEAWERFGEFDPFWAILSLPGQEGNGWDEEAFFRSGKEEVERLLDRLGDVGRPQRFRKALDFGCGVGRLTQPLTDHFEEVVGVDIASSMLRLARNFNRYGPRCQYVQNTAGDLHIFPEASFDLVYSTYVLQHMPLDSARRYIEEFIRVLTPGGVAVFQFPTVKASLPVTLYRSLLSPLRLEILRMMLKRLWQHGLLRGKGATVRPSDMEMHEAPTEVVRRWVRDGGGETLQVTPIFSAAGDYAGIRWDHRCYFVTRR